MASFTKKVNPPLAKCPLKTNGHLANRGLTSLVKEATGDNVLELFQMSKFLQKEIYVKFWLVDADFLDIAFDWLAVNSAVTNTCFI